MTTPEPREDVAVAEVLAAHECWEDGEYVLHCGCGVKFYPDRQDARRKHIAEALAPLIAERVRAASEQAWDEGWWKGQQDRDPTVLGYAENPYRGGGK